MSDQSPIDHSGCVTHLAYRFSHLAHTHEGQKGFWLFPSESPHSVEATAAAIGTTIQALRLELREALSSLERGVESIERLKQLSHGHSIIYDRTRSDEMKALALKVFDYADTIKDLL